MEKISQITENQPETFRTQQVYSTTLPKYKNKQNNKENKEMKAQKHWNRQQKTRTSRRPNWDRIHETQKSGMIKLIITAYLCLWALRV